MYWQPHVIDTKVCPISLYSLVFVSSTNVNRTEQSVVICVTDNLSGISYLVGCLRVLSVYGILCSCVFTISLLATISVFSKAGLQNMGVDLPLSVAHRRLGGT